MRTLKRIGVSGGAGQITYSLIFRLANGDLFGKDQPIALHLLELPAALDSLKGVVMELEDCAFPLLSGIKMGSDPRQVFEGVDTVFLIGAKPRGPGMERKDLRRQWEDFRRSRQGDWRSRCQRGSHSRGRQPLQH